MSELKAFNMPRYAGEFTIHEVYLKSEVDKVIADLEESHKMEVEQLLMEIVGLKKERRWRKFPDEKPSNGQEVLVWLTAGGSHGFVLTSTYLDSQWYYGEDPQGCKPSHWMPLPSAPKEEK